MITLSNEEKLQERIKELRCLYSLLAVMQKDLSLEETLPEFSSIIAAAFLFAPEAVVEIKIEAAHSLSGKLPRQSVSMEKPLLVFDAPLGFVRVHYPAPKYTQDAFIPEEWMLLNKVAAEISSFCEKKIAQSRNALFESKAAHLDRLTILGEITAGIAHELNTPLGNILGFAELIQTQQVPPQIQSDLSKIIKSAVYSREIVKKLMFFSCNMPQHLEQVKVHALFVQVMTLLGPNFKKAGVVGELHFEDENLEALVDSVQFTQILFNILMNSIYAAPRESRISVTVTHDQDNLYFEIADHGSGIPDAVKPKIFEPFFTTKPFGEGTGIGLSVVHGIIRSHGGEISVQDNIPCGVVFRIRMPLH